MRIIKLNAIDSTNTFLRQISSAEALEDYAIVVADYQTKGRGQMGTHWSAQDGKNLTCSVFKDVSRVSIEDQFGISMLVALSVYQALKGLKIPKLFIKWPNDILAENKKICGVLIENVIKKNVLEHSIIGIGLNVNQTNFNGLPNASSILKLTGKHYNPEEIMHSIIKALQDNFRQLEAGKLSALHQEYQDCLFRRNKPSTFKDSEDNLFSGYIKGVTKEGHLKILLEDEIIKEYDLKEVQLLY